VHIPLTSHHVRIHDTILFTVQYSNCMALMIFTLNSVQQLLTAKYGWGGPVFQLHVHYLTRFLLMILPYHLILSCILSIFTCMVRSAHWYPRVVAWKWSHSITYCMDKEAAIWLGRLADSWYVLKWYNINSYFGNLFLTLKMEWLRITLTVSCKTKHEWYHFQFNYFIYCERFCNCYNNSTML